MSLTRLVAAGLLLATLSCGGEAETSSKAEAGTPEAERPRTALDEARRGLSDAQRYPFRDGKKINEEALRANLMKPRERHGAQVALAYAASIEALPVAEAPAAPFEEIAAFSLPDQPAARDVEAINWLFDRDVEETVRRSLSTYFALMSREQLEMPMRDLGVWMASPDAAPHPTTCGCASTTAPTCSSSRCRGSAPRGSSNACAGTNDRPPRPNVQGSC